MKDPQMVHINNNLLCGISIEVTGDNPRIHDIIEICVWPLDNFIKPSRVLPPFYHQLMPFREEAIDYKTASLSREKIAYIKTYGLEPSLVADRFEEWFEAMDLKRGKKIIPVCFNWPTMRSYLETWLGFNNFSHFFSLEYRDIMSLVTLSNDYRNMRAQSPKYPRPLEPPYIGAAFNVRFRMNEDVMVKCLKISEVYAAMVGLPIIRGLQSDLENDTNCMSPQALPAGQTSNNGESASLQGSKD